MLSVVNLNLTNCYRWIEDEADCNLNGRSNEFNMDAFSCVLTPTSEMLEANSTPYARDLKRYRLRRRPADQ